MGDKVVVLNGHKKTSQNLGQNGDVKLCIK